MANRKGLLSLLSFQEEELAAPALTDTYESVFSNLPHLHTERLLLRPMQMRDAADMFEYSKDPLVAQHVLWDAHQSIHQTRAYLRYVLRQYKLGAPSSMCIVEKASGKVIGTIGFMWVQPENRSCEVGYSLSRAHWNKGYMTEALEALLEFGFQDLRMNRIEAQHEVDNPASGRVMTKVGMRPEGILRSRLFNKGRYVDVALYAILRADWIARRTVI